MDVGCDGCVSRYCAAVTVIDGLVCCRGLPRRILLELEFDIFDKLVAWLALGIYPDEFEEMFAAVM